MSVETAYLDTPIGRIAVSWSDGALTALRLMPIAHGASSAELPAQMRDQLARYFADGKSRFDLPLNPRGTPFQRRVWEALQTIPPGRTITYGELAERLGSGARAVGGACRANPCPIVVPCHRVVAKHGLGGFAGDVGGRRLSLKRWLLTHENAPLGPRV
jgi:methylated-DNA-[protein]-cysteine S-methyltransferase